MTSLISAIRSAVRGDTASHDDSADSQMNERNGSLPYSAQDQYFRAGAIEERARVKAILTSSEAEGRGDLASHLALDTDMGVQAALTFLEKTPQTPKATPFVSNGVAYKSYEQMRLAAMDLARPSVDQDRSSGSGRVDLVATMKRRHGVE